MAAINDLLRQIPDTALRERLEQEFSRLSKTKKFGLVFEEHIPECTPLYDVTVQRGSKVAKKVGKIDDLYTVLEINGEMASCLHKATFERQEVPVNELIAVAQFGDPIFPSLIPIAKVENAPDDSLWHTLIEADNYHALQLLEYLYPKQVDCIYIDPPYNTGARDWKYNNDYVDDADNWRHSKWLSMMQKRLRIAKRILKNDGVLITTIDDNEYAHLWVLLNEIFPEYTHNCVTIQHNPGGTQGKKFSVTNEYAIFTYTTESAIYRKPHTGGDVYNLRRWGSTSGRYEGATCFYPIILDAEHRIIGFGELLDRDLHPPEQVEHKEDGTIFVWPIDKSGIEKKWRYSRDTVESVYDRMFAEQLGNRVEIKLRRESEPPKTVWTDPLFNAEAYGTEMLKTIIGGGFSYPKSLYAVREALSFAVSGKKDALIVDFFAGSGTTLHAVNLLNAEDGGHRRCIIVTNNEVSDTEAKEMQKASLQPGDPDWEKHGICRSVTWPRTEYSILGRQSDGAELAGEYFTNQIEEHEVTRTFMQLGFVEASSQLTISKKKQLVALLGKSRLPQSLVKTDSDFIVSDKHSASIIFDYAHVDEYLNALENQDHITEFYIVTKETATFNEAKAKIQKLLGPAKEYVTVKRPMSAGFPANVEYFKLGFLDRYRVTLGQQFREILPLLWLKSGALGKRPELPGQDIPDMLVLPQNNFAILIDETKYAAFLGALAAVQGIKTIYFVTNSEEAFREMASGVKAPHTYQLYRDYIDNFVLGSRRDSL